jgi:hypothetical protein
MSKSMSESTTAGPSSGNSNTSAAGSRRIYIGGVLTDEELATLLQPYGRVREFHAKPEYCFAEFGMSLRSNSNLS